MPLVHSKITFGYLLQSPNRAIAYLTDTVGLSADSALFLASKSIDLLVLDCSHAPQSPPPRNHNDVTMALAIRDLLMPEETLLTHASHQLDRWLLNNSLPTGSALPMIIKRLRWYNLARRQGRRVGCIWADDNTVTPSCGGANA